MADRPSRRTPKCWPLSQDFPLASLAEQQTSFHVELSSGLLAPVSRSSRPLGPSRASQPAALFELLHLLPQSHPSPFGPAMRLRGPRAEGVGPAQPPAAPFSATHGRGRRGPDRRGASVAPHLGPEEAAGRVGRPPACSTIGEILRRRGLSVKQRRRPGATRP